MDEFLTLQPYLRCDVSAMCAYNRNPLQNIANVEYSTSESLKGITEPQRRDLQKSLFKRTKRNSKKYSLNYPRKKYIFDARTALAFKNSSLALISILALGWRKQCSYWRPPIFLIYNILMRIRTLGSLSKIYIPFPDPTYGYT